MKFSDDSNISEFMLPDVLRKKLKIVFCGTAAGTKSAKEKAYYAKLGNKFYRILMETGITPIELQPHQFNDLLKYNLGLTDLVKCRAGGDDTLKSKDYDVFSFTKKIIKFSPSIICFNGKKAAAEVLGLSSTGEISYGIQKQQIGATKLFVAPSTSSRARKYWDEKFWYELKDLIRK